MFDTHCHLNFADFDSDLDSTIDRAKKAGVDYLMIPGVDVKSSKRAFAITTSYTNCFAACGIHPTEDLDKLDIAKEITRLEDYIGSEETILAIGEIGLDYYRYLAGAEVQKRFLRAQITLAVKMDKALILHNRQAADDVMRILSDFGEDNQLRAVFHCCEPDYRLLNYAQKKGIYIGVDGDVTYDAKKQAFVKRVPLDLVVLETDSPNLLPRQARAGGSKTNSPANLVYVAQEVARLKGISIDSLISITTANAQRLFGLTANKS